MGVLLHELNALQNTFNLVVFMESSSHIRFCLLLSNHTSGDIHLSSLLIVIPLCLLICMCMSVYTYMRLHVCLFCTRASTQLTAVQQSSQFTRLSNTTYQTIPITQAILCLHPST